MGFGPYLIDVSFLTHWICSSRPGFGGDQIRRLDSIAWMIDRLIVEDYESQFATLKSLPTEHTHGRPLQHVQLYNLLVSTKHFEL